MEEKMNESVRDLTREESEVQAVPINMILGIVDNLIDVNGVDLEYLKIFRAKIAEQRSMNESVGALLNPQKYDLVSTDIGLRLRVLDAFIEIVEARSEQRKQYPHLKAEKANRETLGQMFNL